MEENAQTFRSHLQRVVSLLNLHIQFQESANNPDFVKKLQMRIELMAQGLPLAIGAPGQDATIAETFEAIEKIVARIYDPEGRNACDYSIGDLPIDRPTLATLSEIFAEFLSNIYSRAAPTNASRRASVLLSADKAGQAYLSVSDDNIAPEARAEPLDQLTSRVVSELARSLGGEARFEGRNIGDARLTFPLAAPAR